MENSEKKTVSRKVIDREVIMRKYHVHIKNFRNLKEVKVTLSPLTILTGENGSGKSTLFKALLFLKHNHDHEAAKKLKYVIDDDINLGGWEHIANDPQKPISIKITEETWGYDHEVEEIYDIDNCPFELNPTEERYAHWKETAKEILKDPFLEQPSNYKRKQCMHLSTVKNSNEYYFENGQLNHIKIITEDRWTFTYEYLNRPFPSWVNQLENVNIFLLTADYLIRINSINQHGNIIPSDISVALNHVALNTLTVFSDPFDNGKEIAECVIQEKNNYRVSNIMEDIPFLVFKYIRGENDCFVDNKYRELLEVSRVIVGNKKIVEKESLLEIFSVNTVREIPKSRYLNEYITENTYYGMFEGFDKINKLRQSANQFQAAHWDYILRTINHWVNQFEFADSISMYSKTDVSTIALRVKDKKWIKLADASSGALQFIPIIYFLSANPSSSTMYLIQQPELHLHPKLQSKVVDFILHMLHPDFTLGIFKVENDSDDDFEYEFYLNYTSQTKVPKFVLLETHSEHLLKKLQVLVSQGKTFNPTSDEGRKLKDALSIYYFAKDKNGNTKAIEMELDDNGFFKTETPKGFFDESLELSRQLLLGRN